MWNCCLKKCENCCFGVSFLLFLFQVFLADFCCYLTLQKALETTLSNLHISWMLLNIQAYRHQSLYYGEEGLRKEQDSNPHFCFCIANLDTGGSF